MDNDTPPIPITIPIRRTVDTDPASGKLLHLDIPRTASEAFAFLSVRAAEVSVKLRSENAAAADGWAMISEVLGKLSEFTTHFPYATARHVRWAYETLLKRVPGSAVETEPLTKWLQRVPACASDKAAPAALLFNYLADCAGMYSVGMPQPQGKANEWFYMKGELALPLSNEQAYALGQQRHFWGAIYRKRLLGVVGILLREICGVEEPKSAAIKPTPEEAEKSAASFAQALENAAEEAKATIAKDLPICPDCGKADVRWPDLGGGYFCGIHQKRFGHIGTPLDEVLAADGTLAEVEQVARERVSLGELGQVDLRACGSSASESAEPSATHEPEQPAAPSEPEPS